MTMRAFPLPADIVGQGARDVLAHWNVPGVGAITVAEFLVPSASLAI